MAQSDVTNEIKGVEGKVKKLKKGMRNKLGIEENHKNVDNWVEYMNRKKFQQLQRKNNS